MTRRPSISVCVLVCVVYAIAALLLACELLIPGRSLFRWDTLLYTWPVALEARSQWLAGHIPFWSSSVCCGTPLLANINAGVLYPLRILIWLLPLRVGYSMFLIAHLVLGLAGMHLLLRRGLRLTSCAAAVGALAFAACGYARGMWDTHNFVALPWIPLGLFALLACRHGGRAMAWGTLGAALCWTMMLLGGDFQTAVMWVPVAGLLCVLHPQRRVLLPALVMTLAVGALIAAPQWVPAAQASFDSYRAGGLAYAEAVERSLHPARLMELFVPNLFGSHQNWLGNSLALAGTERGLPWAASVHVGRIALGLALLALMRRLRAPVRWAALVVLGGMLLSFGGFLPGFRYWLALPVVCDFRYPEKFVLWSSFGFAILAAYGTQTWLALLRGGWWRRAAQLGGSWIAVLAVATAAGIWLLSQVVQDSSRARHGAIMVGVALGICGLATLWVLGLVRKVSWRHAGVLLLLLVLGDGALNWFRETPTTAHFDPLAAPLAATFIRESDAPDGRVLRDPAIRGAPAEMNLEALSIDERIVLHLRGVLDFNSGRLWGLRTAGGFSPIESGLMRHYRLTHAVPRGRTVPDAALLADYCRETGVTWLLTTGARQLELRAAGLDTVAAMAWGPAGAMTLLRVRGASEAECQMPTHAALGVAGDVPRVLGVHRFRPGYFRVDILPGRATTLLVRETWAVGWKAVDQTGRLLPVAATAQGLMHLMVPAGVRQVRLQYTAPGWPLGLWLGVVGLGLVAWLVVRGGVPVRRVVGSPWGALVVSVLLAVGMGVAARAHWSCTFDEGFHVSRGLALLRTGDSRFSYYHPPLQNLLSAYFANLAFGDQIRIPGGKPWEGADIWGFSTQLAEANRTIFPDLVRASRWGSSLLAAIAIGVCVWWAHRLRGLAAAWVVGVGLALNPTLLAHGNLTTTDMGVTAFVVLGTALFWRAVTSGPGAAGSLRGATLAFCAAAVTKHSGLVWLGGYLLLAIPLLAWAWRSARPLRQIPLGCVALLVLLLALYGLEPQVIRGDPAGWWTGRVLPAGRYIEGLVGQAQHSMSGQRAFFHGERMMQCPWWVMLAQLVLKNPPLWCAAAIAGVAAWCVAWRRRGGANRCALIAFIPLAVFTVLWLGANRLAIGVRHGLPLIVFGVLLAGVWAAGLTRRAWRLSACGALLLASLAAATAFPNFIEYYPQWAGGVRGGHRWMVDSNYDWGQNLETLETHWADILDANHGVPPHLMYVGFLDPVSIYGMPVADPSLRGFMGRTGYWQMGAEAHGAWVKSLGQMPGTTVASISALALDPYGAELSELRSAPEIGRIGTCFRVSAGGAKGRAP